MTIVRVAFFAAALGATSAPAAMIHFDDRSDADRVMAQYFESALSSGPMPRWQFRLTATLRREES